MLSSGFWVVALDRAILDKTLTLQAIGEMQDRQIVATALLLLDQGETVALLTKDFNIRDAGVVSTLW